MLINSGGGNTDGSKYDWVALGCGCIYDVYKKSFFLCETKHHSIGYSSYTHTTQDTLLSGVIGSEYLFTHLRIGLVWRRRKCVMFVRRQLETWHPTRQLQATPAEALQAYIFLSWRNCRRVSTRIRILVAGVVWWWCYCNCCVWGTVAAWLCRGYDANAIPTKRYRWCNILSLKPLHE